MQTNSSEMLSTSEEEKEWLHLLLTNDEKALELIFERYYKYLVVTAFNVVNDSHKARDLVQDVFFNFWKKREALNIQTSLKSYLRKAVINRALDEIKKQKRMIWDEEVVEYNQPVQKEEAINNLAAEDLQQVINYAIDQLPEKCRLVFSLSRFEEMSHKEIAAHLSISVKTIENQITKALKVIRSAVEKHED